jgi:hypothetical protein
MNPKKIIRISFIVVSILAQSACGSAPRVPPTETASPDTPTPASTATSADTPTPEATPTLTSTPLPTATFTPNVTATQIPEIPAAAEGKGTVVGLVLWNGQPVPQAAVWLCEEFSGGCKGTFQYRANTDENGYYVFKNVTPGLYTVAINSFNSSWFIFYFDTGGSREQNVSAGGNLILDPWNIWKIDLLAVSPRDGKDLAEAHPAFVWNSYPDAAYYLFTIYDDQFDVVLENKRVDGTEFILEEVTLVTCSYYWTVDAYNADDIKISELKAGGSTVMKLIIHSVPGSC